MNILFVLIPMSVVLLLVMIGTFVWAVRKGQFEDLDTAAIDILSDEAPPPGRLEGVIPRGGAEAGTPPADGATQPQAGPDRERDAD